MVNGRTLRSSEISGCRGTTPQVEMSAPLLFYNGHSRGDDQIPVWEQLAVHQTDLALTHPNLSWKPVKGS